jgi:hypothetical protein
LARTTSSQGNILKLPDKAQIAETIFKAVHDNGVIATLVFDSIERHYYTTYIPISSLCFVGENDSQLILEWKESDTRVKGIFRLSEEDKPLSCLIIQWARDSNVPKIFMKWVVERIEHLSELLQSAQSDVGEWHAEKKRLNFSLPIENWEDSSIKQYHPYLNVAHSDVNFLLDYTFLISCANEIQFISGSIQISSNTLVKWNLTSWRGYKLTKVIPGRDVEDVEMLCASEIEIII